MKLLYVSIWVAGSFSVSEHRFLQMLHSHLNIQYFNVILSVLLRLHHHETQVFLFIHVVTYITS